MQPIRLNQVTHTIGNRTVLQKLSLGFEGGKVTAIIGKSGSGKSMLLKTINGLARPSQGDVLLFEEKIDYRNLQTLRKKIGYVIQGIGLFPHMTLRQNISLPGRMKTSESKATDDRVTELMNLVNLQEHLSEKYPHELSGGEQQRVGICRALFLDPDILLMDEPFSSLDPVTRFDLQQEFLRLQRIAPRTVLVVTHDMREAAKLADEILVIDNGSLQQFSPTQEVLDYPATEVVKELIMIGKG